MVPCCTASWTTSTTRPFSSVPGVCDDNDDDDDDDDDPRQDCGHAGPDQQPRQAHGGLHLLARRPRWSQGRSCFLHVEVDKVDKICIIVCEADLEVLMLFVSMLCSNVEN